MTARIVYLATADARGHLMRAQLLVHALRDAGAHVDVLTTSDAGRRFLATFGIESSVLSRHYAVQFDDRQNMLRGATNRNIAGYIFHPGRMLRDIARLLPVVGRADIVINDSFHPALLFLGALPRSRRKIVHVYGATLKAALLANFDHVRPDVIGRAFSRIVRWQIDSALSCIEHDFAYEVDPDGCPPRFRLPTPVPLAKTDAASSAASAGAAIYLNPHFRSPELADALCAGMSDARLAAHCVGEGYAGRSGWHGIDPDWPSRAAHARLIVSAPGMAALSIAHIYRRPIVLLVTDQPEQMANAQQAARLRLEHRVVKWSGDAGAFRRDIAQAARQLTENSALDMEPSGGRKRAQGRIDAWVHRLLDLCALRAAARRP